jgi:formylglycine-generating enzyme required for sulfatase activity
LKEIGFSDEQVRLLGACVEPKKVEKRPKDARELAEKLAAAVGQPPPPSVDIAPSQPTSPPPQEGPPSTRKLSSTQSTVRQQANAVHAQARIHEKAGQFDEAANLIASLANHLQEPGYLKSLRDRAAEVVALEKELTALDGEARINWRHREKILRLKELSPSLDVADLLSHAPEVPASFTSQAIQARMVLVRPGEFWRESEEGEEEPQRVVMAEPFYIGVHPVTQGQWAQIMERSPSHFRRGGDGEREVETVEDADLRQFPVENVSWADVQRFLKCLNARESNTGWTYRLPTQEEWEFACRGPVPPGDLGKEHCTFSYYAPSPSNTLSPEQANCSHDNWLERMWGGTTKGKFQARPTKVGSYPANGLGLFDMHGNVWELTSTPCEEEWIVRGGSWYVYPWSCTASACVTCASDYKSSDLGFRLVRVPA